MEIDLFPTPRLKFYFAPWKIDHFPSFPGTTINQIAYLMDYILGHKLPQKGIAIRRRQAYSYVAQNRITPKETDRRLKTGNRQEKQSYIVGKPERVAKLSQIRNSKPEAGNLNQPTQFKVKRWQRNSQRVSEDETSQGIDSLHA